LSCDAGGRLFTQLVGRSTYQRIRKEIQQMEVSQNNYATVYWDAGSSGFKPLIVEIGNQETWALERILEHALRSAVMPDVLKKYPEEIIKLGEIQYEELLVEKAGGIRRSKTTTSSRVLDRLSYYRKRDVEVSIPLYKAEYAFPLIILKSLSREKNTLPSQRRLLVLDSDGDIIVITLPLEIINKAKRKLNNLWKKEKEGYFVLIQKSEGGSVEVMEISELQKRALDTVTQYFDETGKGKWPPSDAVKEVLYKAKETV